MKMSKKGMAALSIPALSMLFATAISTPALADSSDVYLLTDLSKPAFTRIQTADPTNAQTIELNDGKYGYEYGGEVYKLTDVEKVFSANGNDITKTLSDLPTAATPVGTPGQTTGTTVSSVSAINATTTVGGTTGFVFKDSTGAVVTPSDVTYSVTSSNASTGFFNNGVFTATAAGTYTIQATIGTTNVTTTVTVVGQAAGVTISLASPSILDNGTATDEVTATVVDANGNTVTNFNGSATITGLTAGALANGGIPVDTNGIASTGTTFTVNFTNGVATFYVKAPSSVNTDTVTLSGLTPTLGSALSGINYGSAKISYTAAAIAGISLTPATSSVSANYATPDVVTVGLLDAAGAPITTGTAPYVTFTISGPGKFDNGTTTYSTYVPTAGTTLNINSVQGQTGAITVTATAAGLTQATTTINSVITQAASTFTVTPTSGTVNSVGNTATSGVLAGGTPFTLYTIQLTDANGNAVIGTTDGLTISDNIATTGGTLKYYAVANGQPTGAGTVTPSSLTPAIASSNGQYEFAVVNTSVGSTNPTITIKDAVTNTTKTASYTFNSGSAAYALFSGETTGTRTAAIANLAAGKSATYTVSLQDASGNPLTTAGQQVAFYFDAPQTDGSINGSTSWTSGNPLVVTTNAQGQASVTLDVSSTATPSDTIVIDAQVVGSGNIAKNTVTVQGAAAYTTNVVLATAASGAGSTTSYTWPTTSMNAGQTLAGTGVVSSGTGTYTGEDGLYVSALNAVDALTGTTDKIQIVTSNKNVLAITAGGGWTNPSGDGVTFIGSSGSALPTITAQSSGNATLTVTDLSVPGVPAVSQNFTVAASAPTNVLGTNPDGTTNTAYTFASAGVSGAFTLTLTDNGGNAVNATAPVTLTSAQVLSALGAGSVATGVRTSASGTDVASVTIPVGQSSVTVYVDGITANTSTSATPATSLSSEYPALTSATVNGNTVTLTFNNPVTGTATAGKFAVTDASSPDVVLSSAPNAPVVTGDTVTLKLTTPVSNGDTVTFTYTSDGLLTDGYLAPVQTITSAPVINVTP